MNIFRNIPTVTKHLLLINIVAFLASEVLQMNGIRLEDWGGLHFFLADAFNPLQFVTYQFLHGGWTHLFFNMFALWMFGCVIEQTWGSRKFLFYYLACGVFAGVCQEAVQYVKYVTDGSLATLSLDETIRVAMPYGGAQTMTVGHYLDAWMTIGASGAVYGILLAFGMTYPESRMFIFPIPFPVKAKWLVIVYAAIELFSATTSHGDGIAHTAHLGGMLAGLLMILYWRKHPGNACDRRAAEQWMNRMRSRQNYGRQQASSAHTGTHATNTREADYEYNAEKQRKQAEVDAILDKIRKSGYDSLTKEEKKRLFEASRDKQ